ncbi:tyrosine-type recombinase/integrase [Novipirellula artificiosorum]|uniref:Tyrosine recombinase XerC n=1 Tax=Novipirellula artificiosorum TaxID=2528016 RepID=A0A5C6DGQ7_9BACT|nr:tyrosine-type recombinase/integrase [Novipirellula artificiosorum]TWU34911.1 Tyrosine recombinase XerC [Novipirellula artificiosorum]
MDEPLKNADTRLAKPGDADLVPVATIQGVSVRNQTDNEMPALVAAGGAAAQFAWEEFIYGKIRNPHTRAAYAHAVSQFLRHCKSIDKELPTITPRDVGSYLDGLAYAPATKKLHLSALRHFFDTLVTRHVVVLNAAASVRGERLQVVEGKTPEMSTQQARKLMSSIDVESIVGLRDRAIIGILIYTAARVGAIAKLQMQHYFDTGEQYCLRFTEKGGKSREIPVRHDLQQFITAYRTSGVLDNADKSTPLFRSVVRRTKRLTENAMTAGDIGRMLKRRLRNAGLPSRLSPHSFRVTTITDLLSQGVPLEDVQNLAGHADPRTTRLYDRRQRKVTRNIVERISI